MSSWNVVPPLWSVVVYYREPTHITYLLLGLMMSLPSSARVVKTFHDQRRDIRAFLASDSRAQSMNYIRILALSSIDILLTLPLGIVAVALVLKDMLSFGALPFYTGWNELHSNWTLIERVSYTEFKAFGTSVVTEVYFMRYVTLTLAFAIFCLFGATAEARASYGHILCTAGNWLGWTPDQRIHTVRSRLSTMEFSEQHQSQVAAVETG